MILDTIVADSGRRAELLPEQFTIPSYHPISLEHSIRNQTDRNAVIAEIKFASPSRGQIRSGISPSFIADRYISGGCTAISVLTEPAYFKGDATTIPSIRECCPVPILRKDFIVDLKQIQETRALGADALLLIAAVLEDRLDEFVSATFRSGLEPLVEVHTSREVKMALDTDATIIGVNNRDLSTLRIDLGTTARLGPAIRSAGKTVIAESGMIWPCDIRSLRRYAHGFLVGSGIMSAKNLKQRLEGFVYA
jgi:indole-3-glycerol phosphate synthase